MSTRCMAIVRSKESYWNGETDTVEIARIYRHCDGYPEGMGIDIAEACKQADEWYMRNNRNWAQPFLHALLGMDADMELCGPNEWHSDIEYLYVVTAERDLSGGKVGTDSYGIEIAVYEGSWDAGSCEELMDGQPMFVGDWRAFEERFSDGPTVIIPSCRVSLIKRPDDGVERLRFIGNSTMVHLDVDRGTAVDDILLAIEDASGVAAS